MGWSFRKSKSLGPVRLTLSKGGLGVSVGGKLGRIGIGADNRVRGSLGIPGTGLRYHTPAVRLGQGGHAPRQAAAQIDGAPGPDLLPEARAPGLQSWEKAFLALLLLGAAVFFGGCLVCVGASAFSSGYDATARSAPAATTPKPAPRRK